jgi:hypothetical protein
MDALWLEARGERRRIDDALVLVLHSTEDAEPSSDDIELEFFVEEVAPGYSITAPLSAFLQIWLPKIADGRERAIVLALCNPQRAELGRPSAAGATPIVYGLGDVGSVRDDTDLGPVVSLIADEWRTV